MINTRIHTVLFMLNFTDVVSNVQVVDQSPSADEEMSIFWGSNFQCFGDSGESVGLSGIIFNVFGAQLRKSKYKLRVCEPLRFLLLLAAHCNTFLL